MVDRIERVQTLDRGRCRAWIQERFSVEKMIDGYERLYQGVLNGPPRQEIYSKSNHVP